MNKLQIKISRISQKFSDIPLPEYQTEFSSGMDVRAAVEKEMKVQAGKTALVPTNLKMEIPTGYEIQVRPRSGLAVKHGIGILNSPGTIDSDYRGEIKIILFNYGQEDFFIKRGDRIAQLVIGKVFHVALVETDNLVNTKRGEGGFGHTGKT